jgi:hypothetical protein
MEERAMLLEELVAAGVDPSRMMPGTGCCSIMETVELTAQIYMKIDSDNAALRGDLAKTKRFSQGESDFELLAQLKSRRSASTTLDSCERKSSLNTAEMQNFRGL